MASRLKPGDIVGLVGELGAGKTTLIQMIAKNKGIKHHLTSPSFVYLKIYPFAKDNLFVHADIYRLNKEQDVESIGLKEYFNNPQALVCVEWADKIKEIMPVDTIWIEIKQVNNKTRQLSINQASQSKI